MHTTIKKITIAIIIFTGIPSSNWAATNDETKKIFHEKVITEHEKSIEALTSNKYLDYTTSYGTFDNLLAHSINTDKNSLDDIKSKIYDPFRGSVVDDLAFQLNRSNFDKAQLDEMTDNTLFQAVLHNANIMSHSTFSEKVRCLATPELLAVYPFIRHSKENQGQGNSYRTIREKIKITGCNNIRIFKEKNERITELSGQKITCRTRIQKNDRGLKGAVALACLIVFLKCTYFKGMQAPLALVPLSALVSLKYYLTSNAIQKKLTKLDVESKNYMILPIFFTT